MSWGGVPFWVYDLIHEHNLARMSCAFEEEWFSGTSKIMPSNAIRVHKSNFESYNPGGFNHEESNEL